MGLDPPETPSWLTIVANVDRSRSPWVVSSEPISADGTLAAVGIIRQLSGESRVTLYSRHKVGRLPDNQLVIKQRVVSGNHALLVWQTNQWTIRDLGSLNGTSVNGTPLVPGTTGILKAGDIVAFGDQTQRWTLESDGPPQAAAVNMGSGKAIESDGELLILPHEDDPLVSIFPDNRGNWVCERMSDTGGSLHSVKDLERLTVGNQVFQLHLPEAVEGTISHKPVSPTLETIEMVIRHTADWETDVRVQVYWPGGGVDLGSSTHNRLLLILAQRLIESRADKTVDPWMFVDEVLSEMGTPRTPAESATLNVWIFRCRKGISSAGVEGPAGLIERRPQARQLRLGIERVRLEVLSS